MANFLPPGGIMASPGKTIVFQSTLDCLIDVAGCYFPVRTLKVTKGFTNTPEYGSGDHDPIAIVNQEHKHSGTLSFAGFLVNGTPAMASSDVLVLEALLTDQNDEGVAVYFDLNVLNVPGKRTPSTGISSQGMVDDELTNPQSFAGLKFIEQVKYAKVDKMEHDYGDKATVVTNVDFTFIKKTPY